MFLSHDISTQFYWYFNQFKLIFSKCISILSDFTIGNISLIEIIFAWALIYVLINSLFVLVTDVSRQEHYAAAKNKSKKKGDSQ